MYSKLRVKVDNELIGRVVKNKENIYKIADSEEITERIVKRIYLWSREPY